MDGEVPLLWDADLPNERHREALAILWSLDEWPQDYRADVDMIRRLAHLYPKVDLAAEAAGWLAWFTGKYRAEHPRKKVAHRHRFMNWIKKATEWAEQKALRGGIRHRRPGTIDEHGTDEPRVVSGW